MSSTVLVVGAGPTGLILALSLLQNDVSVRIIDKEKSFRAGEKGAGIMPRTLELHNILGTLPDILKIAGPIPRRRAYTDGGKSFTENDIILPAYTEPKFHSPYPSAKMLGQNYLETILRQHLKKYDVEVELATALEKFEQNDDHVVANIVKTMNGNYIPEQAKFSFLVGADGAHSVVRKQLGVSFLGETMEQVDMLVGDIVLKEGLERNIWHFWGELQKKIVFVRPSAQNPEVVCFLVGGPEANIKNVATTMGREKFIEVVEELSGRNDLNFGEMRWISKYRPNIRMVDKFHVGRVFVAGDAAHCHTPAGGQGMNSSSQDAFNLGWKMALVIKGLAPSSLLDSYDEERIPVIAEMLNMTTMIFKKTLNPINEKEKEESWNRGEGLHMLGVNYRFSSLVVDDGTLDMSVTAAYNPASVTAARAGDRAPDAPELQQVSPSTEETSLFRLFGSIYHTVLVFGGSAEQHKTVLEKLAKLPGGAVKSTLILPSFMTKSFTEGFDVVVYDSKGHAFDGYHVPAEGKQEVVIVRPDGIVGARLSALENIDTYFSKIFVK